MEKVVAFVPIKYHSQRLHGKNFLDFMGRPLCTYIFETLTQISGVDERYVYCSNPDIKKYLPDGVRFKKRDEWLDGDEVKGLDIIEAFVADVDADVYIITHATQPFTKASSIDHGLRKVLEDGYDSAFSCVEHQDYFWYQGKPLNYDMKDIVTTQQVDPLYMETGAFFIFRKEVFTKLHQRIGANPYRCLVDRFEAIDIDTEEDFVFAEAAGDYLRKMEDSHEKGRYS